MHVSSALKNWSELLARLKSNKLQKALDYGNIAQRRVGIHRVEIRNIKAAWPSFPTI